MMKFLIRPSLGDLAVGTLIASLLAAGCARPDSANAGELRYYLAATAEPAEGAELWISTTYRTVLGNDVPLWRSVDLLARVALPEGVERGWLQALPLPVEGGQLPKEAVGVQLDLADQPEQKLHEILESVGPYLVVVFDQEGNLLGTGEIDSALLAPGGVFRTAGEALDWYSKRDVRLPRDPRTNARSSGAAESLQAYLVEMRWHVECNSEKAHLYEVDYQRLKPLLDAADSLPTVDCDALPPGLESATVDSHEE